MNIKTVCNMGDLGDFELALAGRLPVVIKTAHSLVAPRTVKLLMKATLMARGQPGSPPGAVASGKLLGGYIVMGQGSSVTVANTAVQRISMRRYMWNVEWGRPKGRQPPLDMILDWCRDRLGMNRSAKSTRRIAFAIARKIGRKGLLPRNFIMDIQPEIARIHVEAVRYALDSEIEKIESRIRHNFVVGGMG